MSEGTEICGPVDSFEADVPAAVTIAVTTALTKEGYRGLLLHLSALRLRLIFPWLALLGFLALASGFEYTGAMVFAVIVAVVLTVWGYVQWLTASPSNQELYLPVAYEFGPEGIVFAGKAGAGTISWSQVKRWDIRADFYLLYVAGASYLVVGTGDLEPDGTAPFERLLSSHVKKGPKRRRWGLGSIGR